jgi:peptidoglycan/LPS O-acetylase OafA/YrhL
MSQRVSTRVNNFDLLRLLAALQVAFFHSARHLDLALDRDNVAVLLGRALPGVPIFYVISGFLISLSWERNHALGQYARNRFLRIYPALWMCLGVSVAAAAWFGGVGFLRVEAGPWLLAQLTIAQFYNPDFLRPYGVGVLNGSLWTIPVELQFYLLLPLLYRGLRLAERRGNGSLALIALLSLGVNQAYVRLAASAPDHLGVKLLYVSLAPHLYMFLMGVLIQRNFTRLSPLLAGRGAFWLLAYALAVGVARALGATLGSNTPNPLLMGVLALTVISCAYSAAGLSERLLRGNDISYGTYIYHMVVVNAAIEMGASPTFRALAIVLAITLVAAWASWVLVERPALARKRNPLHPVSAAASPHDRGASAAASGAAGEGG